MSDPVPGQLLGNILRDHDCLRLAVLNACEGARQSNQDPFSGVAQSLCQQRLPAVVAMQFEISDDAAKTFAEEFYGAIADGLPVDAAVSESRKALFSGRFGQEWATPVLYMRSSSGVLFEVQRRAKPAVEPKPAPQAEPNLNPQPRNRSACTQAPPVQPRSAPPPPPPVPPPQFRPGPTPLEQEAERRRREAERIKQERALFDLEQSRIKAERLKEEQRLKDERLRREQIEHSSSPSRNELEEEARAARNRASKKNAPDSNRLNKARTGRRTACSRTPSPRTRSRSPRRKGSTTRAATSFIRGPTHRYRKEIPPRPQHHPGHSRRLRADLYHPGDQGLSQRTEQNEILHPHLRRDSRAPSPHRGSGFFFRKLRHCHLRVQRRHRAERRLCRRTLPPLQRHRRQGRARTRTERRLRHRSL